MSSSPGHLLATSLAHDNSMAQDYKKTKFDDTTYKKNKLSFEQKLDVSSGTVCSTAQPNFGMLNHESQREID